MTQLNLFPSYESSEDKFLRFHHENPHVYVALVSMARKLRAAGRNHYGIAALFEKLRFDQAISTTGDTWKLNNTYRAFYARMIERREIDLRGFFETRERKTS